MSRINIPTEKELMVESHEIFEQKKTAGKHMNMIATETAKQLKVQKSLLNRLKDYYLYRGIGWVSKNPLSIDKAAKTYDKVSPLFIKLLQIVEDLRAVDSIDFLDPYIKELNSYGIKIYFDPKPMTISDKDEAFNAVNSMGAFQKQINALNGEIKEIKAVEADEINLTAKSEFPRLLSFYHKKELGKDIDDEYQNKITHLELVETGYTKVMDNSLT
jgi:hypothetical protein